MVGQEDLPKFRRHKDDRRYYEAPGRFPLNTAYTEVNKCVPISLNAALKLFSKFCENVKY